MQSTVLGYAHLNKTRALTLFILCLTVTAFCSLGLSLSPKVPSWYRLGGFIPFSDAGNYYSQVLNWPAESFDAWNSRRPLNSPLNILQFDIGQRSLLGTLVVRIVLLALSIGFFVVALAGVAGSWPAIVSGILLIAWSFPYTSTMLSETNGIALAATGFGCLLLGMQAKRIGWIFWGVVGLAMATALRPYNPLFPLLAGIVAVVAMPWSWGKRLAVGAAIALLAMVVVSGGPRIAYAVYGHPDGSVGGNTGYTVLGLARGSDWVEASTFIQQHHPSLSEREKNALMYELAIKAVLEDPRPALKSLLSGLASAFRALPQEVARGFGWKTEVPTIAVFLVYTLLAATLVCCVRSTAPTVVGLMLVSLVSLFSMAPVVYNDGGWRIAASLYPGLSMVAACPFFLSRRFWPGNNAGQDSKPTPFQELGRWTIWPGQLVVVFALIALPYPMLTRVFTGELPREQINNTFVVQFDDSKHEAQWTGFNEGRAPRTTLQDWMRQFGFKEWETFFQAYGKSVRELRNERGKLVLTVADSEAVSNQPDPATLHRWAPRFLIQIRNAESGSTDNSF